MSSDPGAAVQPLVNLVTSLDTREPSEYPVDGMIPDHAVRPASTSELQEIVRAAHAERMAIIPWGGGSQMGFGNVPLAYQIAVDLSALNEVIRYESDDMTMSVQTGCRLAELNAMLAQNRQVLPVDTADPDRATIGGMVAVGASGPRRFGYGPLRDLIIGMTVLLPDGTIAKAGGQVVKNVTGYDMMRLHHGALGSLGIILSVNLKVIPKPRSERTVLASFATLDAADRAARSVAESQLGVTALVLLNPPASAEAALEGDSHWTVAARCEAPPSAVVRQAERVMNFVEIDAQRGRTEAETERSEAIWRRICQALDQRPDSGDIAVRFGCPASRMYALTEAVDGTLGEFAGHARLTLDYGSGLAYARLSRQSLSGPTLLEACDAVTDLGDHISLMTGPVELKQHIDAFGREPAGLSALQSLKGSFDERGILNRGRYIMRL